MHVASVSKLMTAMAMMVLFRDKNISPDAQIIDYLPDYWEKGPNIEYIVFRNLFNHTSGLSANYLVDFDSMKSAIAGGINLPSPGGNNQNDLGHYNYQNLNYGLCRILLPVINGDIDQSADPSTWDQKTTSAYEAYLQAKVFQPSGVVGATLDHPSAGALSYVGPGDSKPGWNSGNLEGSCGCDGWHLSVNQLLDVMGESFLCLDDSMTSLSNSLDWPHTNNNPKKCGDYYQKPPHFCTLHSNIVCLFGHENDR